MLLCSALVTTAAENEDGNSKSGALGLEIAIGLDDDVFVSSSGKALGAKGETLYREGESLSRFSCSGDASTLAVEPSTMAVRRFSLRQTTDGGFFEGLTLSQKQAPGVWVTDGNISAIDHEGTQDVLLVALEDSLTSGQKIEVDPLLEPPRIGVLYDCRKDGSATVELRLRVGSSDGSSGSVCLRWVKRCALGWNNLAIMQGDTPVFKDGQIQERWSRLAKEGTEAIKTVFTFSASEGVVRIARPMAYSEQNFLSVAVNGPLGVPEISEIGEEGLYLTALYTCHVRVGFSDVTLEIYKDTFSGEEPETLKITWKVHCGEVEYKHLEVSIKSDAYKNSTKAISGGKVNRGFERPCKGDEVQALAATPRQRTGAQCSRQPPSLEISEKEMRTVLELEVDKDGVMEPPSFHPAPDISYDHSVVRVTVLQSPYSSGSPAKDRKHYANQRRNRQSITLKYLCHKEGVSIVEVALYVQGFKSIRFAFNKRCGSPPKAKLGKALTAPQAIMITLFVCGIVVLAICLCFSLGGSKEEHASIAGPYHPRLPIDANDDGVDRIEMPSKFGAPTEVTYH